ncbi:hypothetical protein OPT61_g2397 [Boeremia exigua]|uniref:Uncharacterized protein n=1 Tax=Boeremia exigua TaxID=749465 RepID=A0ACC2ILS5_9PLEO|nr:hypothetical protein OPT61_g2397 [Boeremia exigua]
MAECRHPDIHQFGDIRCCLSCGEALFETAPRPECIADDSNSLGYRYKSLRHTIGEEIRIIVLYAGEPSDDLLCDIVIVNLADRPAYEAVSHTWADANGDDSMSSNIICHGKTIPITRNCDSALRRLRLQSRNRRLWVDSICIDQKSTVEKNRQVKLMSRIYMKASQVLAYTGIEPDQVTKGLERIISYLQDKDTMTMHGPRIKEHLEGLFKLAYFDRVWILQEIGLSQLVTLIIGAHEVRWTGAAISKTLNLSSALGIQAPSILQWNPARRPEEEKDVLTVLSKSRNCSATDPRDKVYALLGLVHSEFSDRFGVDYSLSSSEVFTKLAIYCVNLGRFDVLQHARHASDADLYTPTWVPHWHLKDVFKPPPLQFSQADKDIYGLSWRMSHVQPRAWVRLGSPQRLLIGQIFHYIETKLNTRVDSINYSSATWRQYVQKYTQSCSEHEPDQPLFSSGDIEYVAQQICKQHNHRFACKIVESDAHGSGNAAGGTHPPRTLPFIKLRAHRLDRIIRVLSKISNARHFCIPEDTWPALGSRHCQSCIQEKIRCFKADALKQERTILNSNIELYGSGKVAFITSQSVGFTRGDFRPGDSIWHLYGADVPFILREVKDHYHLVGDCYLHKAGQPFPCKQCGADMGEWPMQTEIIDLW